VDKVLDRGHHGLSIISSPPDDASCNYRGHGVAALRRSSKLAMMQRASCGLGTSLTVYFGCHRQPSLPMTMLSRSTGVQGIAAKLDRPLRPRW
jgi:hypothetical protein